MNRDRETDKSQVYRIRVQGNLDERWSDWFSGLAIEVELTAGDVLVTTLTGVVLDQPALRGILSKIWDLGLALISVQQIEQSNAHRDSDRD